MLRDLVTGLRDGLFQFPGGGMLTLQEIASPYGGEVVAELLERSSQPGKFGLG